MNGVISDIIHLVCHSTAFAVVVLLTLLFALVYELVATPSPELIFSLLGLLVSTAVLEFRINRAR